MFFCFFLVMIPQASSEGPDEPEHSLLVNTKYENR